MRLATDYIARLTEERNISMVLSITAISAGSGQGIQKI